MRRIAIITLTGYFNFGNRLQNYALQKILSSYGFSVDTIKVIRPLKKTKNNTNLFYKLGKVRNKSLGELLTILYAKTWGKYQRYQMELLNKIRTDNFKIFSKKYNNETDFFISEENIPVDLSEKYNYFIVGSDQVWNPNFIGKSSLEFLTFAPEYKRIAYSASFGISALPEGYMENYKLWLSQMEHISVREEAGAEIIRKLIGKTVEVLIDPTLMIDKDEWLIISKKSKHKPKNPYLLTYFLGTVSPEINKFMNKIAQQKKLEIVRMADFKDKLRYVTDPGEFIDYLNSSEIILTDSFHGAIFSILFEKPFIIFERRCKTSSMNSRIGTLLAKLQLENRKWEIVKEKDNPFKIDFSHVPPILELERKKSLDYLKKALDINDEI